MTTGDLVRFNYDYIKKMRELINMDMVSFALLYILTKNEGTLNNKELIESSDYKLKKIFTKSRVSRAKARLSSKNGIKTYRDWGVYYNIPYHNLLVGYAKVFEGLEMVMEELNKTKKIESIVMDRYKKNVRGDISESKSTKKRAKKD